MSRIRYEPIGTSAVRSVTDLNTIFADLETASAAIDSANLAEEGIDQTVVELETFAEERDRTTLSTRTLVPPQVWGPLLIPTPLRATITDVADGSVVRCRALIRIESGNGIGFGFNPLVGDIYQFRMIRFHTATVTTTLLDAPARHRGQIIQGAADVRQAHGDMLWECWLIGPIVDIDYVEVQYQNLGTGDINVDLANLTLDEFRRVTVL